MPVSACLLGLKHEAVKEIAMTLSLILQSAYIETTSLRRAILHTLAYADVFDYPLTACEVHRYLTGVKASYEEVSQALNEVDFWHGLLARTEPYFTLYRREAISQTRARRKSVSRRLWQDAKFYGRILAALPFVRMVAVTGSLAMENVNESGDIDYFIVTSCGRLWTCRAMSLLIVHIAKLVGVTLCPNYFVAKSALVLSDRSLYAAHELVQMIPLDGIEIYNEMRRLNGWTDEYLPNAQGTPELFTDIEHPSRWQFLLEALLNLLPIKYFEAWEMKRKIEKLSRKQSFSPEAHFSAEVCKGHANRHGQKTELALNERLKGLGLA
jgi:hypothetical protein